MARFEFYDWLLKFLTTAIEFEFDWDQGNHEKSVSKHGVSIEQTESAFYDKRMIILGIQVEPAHFEKRFAILAKDKFQNVMFISFTVRNKKLRPISTRLANKKERLLYDKVR